MEELEFCISFVNFQKGLAAYQSGDYATDLREFTPLTEQGYVPAQYNLGQMYRRGRVATAHHAEPGGSWRTPSELGKGAGVLHSSYFRNE